MSAALASHQRGPAAIRAYYNEIDPFAADWIRALMAHGLIASGDVDTRSITDVRPSDLRGYTQCHFFAGIGGWSYALRQAGWDDTRPVWTGSCPCQPFSLAGKQKGFDDERHLWPVWRELIRECAPAVVFGEQVASATDWLRLVRGDLEAMGRAVGAMPIQAASAGADHLRDRYWFVAADMGDAEHGRREGRQSPWDWSGATLPSGEAGLADADRVRGQINPDARGCSEGGRAGPIAGFGGAHDGDMGDGESDGRHVRARQTAAGLFGAELNFADADSHDMADAMCSGTGDASGCGDRAETETVGINRDASRAGTAAGIDGSDLEWVTGADGKARRVKSGIRLLAHGVPNRVGTLRGFGNSIDYRPAKEFIGAFIDTMRATALSSKDGTGGAA